MSALVEQLRRRSADAADAYARLVRDAAGDADVDPDEAADILAAAEKSPADLDADIQRLTDRKRWWSQVDSVPGLTAQRAKVLVEQSALDREKSAAIVELERKRQHLLREFDARDEQVRAKLAQVDAELAAAHEAKRQLVATAPAELTAAGESLAARRDAAYARLADIDRRIKAARNPVPGYVEGLQAQREAAVAEMSRLGGELDRVTDQKLAP